MVVSIEATSVAAVAVGPPVTLGSGDVERTVMGPAAIAMAGSTCWVAEDWTAQVGADGTIRMVRT